MPRKLALLPLLLLTTTLALAQAPSVPTLRVGVRLVNVLVSVTDPHGAPIPDLDRTNFTLAEDNHSQTVAFFERETATPLSLVLAIDTSGSTRKDLPLEQRAARDFIHSTLRPSSDQLAVFDFNSDVREAVPFTSDLHRIDSGLSSLTHGPATAFYSAIFLASQSLASAPQPVVTTPAGARVLSPPRRVLVVVSDGSDTVGGTTYDQALEQALRSEVLIYSIIDVPIEADAGRDTGGEHAMITLAQETGGKYFYADSAHLPDAFRRIADDLRTQYLLGYYPRELAPGEHTVAGDRRGYHSISVSLAGLPPGTQATAHYRTGYFRRAEPPQP